MEQIELSMTQVSIWGNGDDANRFAISLKHLPPYNAGPFLFSRDDMVVLSEMFSRTAGIIGQ